MASETLRASVTATTPVDPGGPARILIDGSDTAVTANGLANYTPTPGDRLLVQQVGQQVEILQFISQGTVPYLPSDGAYSGPVSVSQLISGILQPGSTMTVGAAGDYAGASNVTVTQPGVDSAGKPTGGIVVTDPTNPSGEPLVRLHPLGCTFRGKVITDILTVMQDLIINGTASLSAGAVLTLNNGVSNPTTPPDMAVGSILESPWDDNGYAMYGYVQKGMYWSAADNVYYRILWQASGKRLAVHSVNPTTGAFTSIFDTTDGTSQMVDVSTLIKVGSNFYIAAQIQFSGNPDVWCVKRYSAAGADSALYPRITSALNINGTPAITYDSGTNQIVSAYKAATNFPADPVVYPTSPTFANHILLQAYDLALNKIASSYADLGVPSNGTGTYYMRHLEIGSFDYGAASYSIAGVDSAQTTTTVLRFPYVAAPTAPNTAVTGAEDATKAWTLPSIANGGLTWKGSNFVSTQANNAARRWSGYYPAAGEASWWAKYQDNDGGAGHTASSSVGTVIVPARRFVTITLRPAPAGVTGADLWVGYGNSAPANYYKQTATLVSRGFTLSAKNTTGTTTVPATSTFAANNSIIQSQVGGFLVRGDGTSTAPTPTAPLQIANKAYVDGVYGGEITPTNLALAGSSGFTLGAYGMYYQRRSGAAFVFFHLEYAGSYPAGRLIATLPVGLRPSRAILFGAKAGSITIAGLIGTDGTVTTGDAGSTGFLGQVSFPTVS